MPGHVEVEFCGGHLDGARLAVPCDRDGRPVAELRVLPTGLPAVARWTGEQLEAVPVVPAVYRRAPFDVGGVLFGWRMLAEGYRPP